MEILLGRSLGGCEGSESASVAAKDRRVGKLDIEIGVIGQRVTNNVAYMCINTNSQRVAVFVLSYLYSPPASIKSFSLVNKS